MYESKTKIRKIKYKYNIENLNSFGAKIVDESSLVLSSLKAKKIKYEFNNSDDTK